jgi:hypothetical protein
LLPHSLNAVTCFHVSTIFRLCFSCHPRVLS